MGTVTGRSSRPGEVDIRDTYIIFLGEAEELADLRGTLGTETLGVDGIGDTWDVVLSLLDDGEGKDREIHGDDASTDRLALALTSSAWAVAGVAIREQETDTGWVHDSLLHWETLLVVATGDLEDISLELVSDAVTGNLLAHSVYPVRKFPSRIARSVLSLWIPYLLSMNTRSLRSSSTSMSFWLPLAGYCIVSWCSSSNSLSVSATSNRMNLRARMRRWNVRRRCSRNGRY